MPNLSRLPLRIATALLVAGLSAGCRRPAPDGSRAATSASLERLREDLALVPAEARLVFSLDLDRLRATPVGNRLLAAPLRVLGQIFAELAQGAGIDLPVQARRLLVALPGERQADDRWLLVLEVSALDPARAGTWLRSHQTATSAGFVAGDHRLVLARGAWAAPRPSRKPSGELPDNAAGDEELRRLCERAAQQPAVWLAAIVPAPLRQRLIAEDRFPDVASVARLYGSLGADAGLQAELVAELSNEPDARLLAHRLGAFLHAAKRHPDLLAHGLSPYLEGVLIAAHGPAVRATLALPSSEAGDLVARLEELLPSAFSGFGASSPP